MLGSLIQTVSFEIGVGCNLTDRHPQCPASLGLARYAHLSTDRRLDADAIITLIRLLYEEHGFRGWFNFSHYNEPLLHPHLLVRLAKIAQVLAPECPRMVITNGTRMPSPASDFAIFTEVHITDYGDPEVPLLVEALSPFTLVLRNEARLDSRMRGPGPDRSDKGCLYPFNDLTIDAFGNVRLCCFDWQGLASPGNLFRDGLPRCLANWERTVRALAQSPMAEGAPAVCRTCRHTRFQTLGRRCPPARRAAKAWLRESIP